MANIFLSNTSSREKPTIVLSVFPANKGLASGISSEFLPAEFMPTCNNVIIPHTGARRTRPGMTQYTTSTYSGNKVTWLNSLWKYDIDFSSMRQSVIFSSGGGFWADTHGDGVFSLVGSVDTENCGITGDSLIGLMMIGVEGQGLYTYTTGGTISALDVDQPKGWIVRKHRGSFFVTGVEGSPDVVHRSAFESSSFTTGNYRVLNIDLNASDPEGNTALFPEFQGRLYLAKSQSLYELDTTLTSIPVRPVSLNIGCISHNAVQEAGGDIIFPSTRGLHSLRATANYGDFEDKFISRQVLDLWQDSIDIARGKEISSCYIPEYDSYMMLYPVKNSTTQFNLLGYNINSGDFYLWEDYPATYINSAISPTDKAIRMYIGDSVGRIARGNLLNNRNYTDLENTYTTSFSTPVLFPGQVPNIDYKFKTLNVFFRKHTGTITITYQIDQGAIETETLDQTTFESTTGMHRKAITLRGLGRSIQFTFTSTPASSTEAAAFEVLGYTIECEATDSLYRIV